MSEPKSQNQDDCVDDEQLIAFYRGLPGIGDVDAVAAHIEACPNCNSRWHALDPGLDPIFASLRKPNPLTDIGGDTVREPASGNPDPAAELPDRAIAETRPFGLTDRLPRKMRQYRELRLIASGGMGVVLRGRDSMTGDDVAVKMIRSDALTSEVLQRFKVEREAMERLRHEHVVTVIDSGVDRGHPFYAMEFMAGGDLESRLCARNQTMSEEEAVLLLLTLSQAVAYSHEQGIWHRDLKPANILFTKDGVPKIADFGLARIFDAAPDYIKTVTRSNAVFGTPAYMAPEQARGDMEAVGNHTDVYALGAILYRALTTRSPFEGTNDLEILEKVRDPNTLPTPLSKLNPAVADSVEAICLKCLNKSVDSRYGSAHELAAELDRWISGSEPLVVEGRRRDRRRRVLKFTLAGAVGLYASIDGVPRVKALWDDFRERREIERQLRSLRQIKSRILEGERVTLAGQSGLPAWSQVVGHTAGDEVLRSRGASQACVLGSTGDAVALLLDSIDVDSYRVTAELKHEMAGATDACAGFIIGHHVLTAESVKLHFGCTLWFNEIEDAMARRMRLPEHIRRQQPDAPEGNPIFLDAIFFREDDGITSGEAQINLRQSRFQRDVTRVWRQIVIEVRRDDLVVTGDWFRGDFRESLAKANRHLLDGPDARLLKESHLLKPGDGSTRVVSHNGGLGVFVRNGDVSFRNVKIQRLL